MTVSKQMVGKENEIVHEDLETENLDLDFLELDEDFGLPDSEEDESDSEENEELDYEQERYEDEKEVKSDKEGKDELEDVEFTISDLIPSVSTVVNRIAVPGILSVINSRNGKRVSFSSEIYERLEHPTALQVAYFNSQMVIGQYLGDEHPSFDLKTRGAKRIIYNKELVDQITRQCGLDFTNRTSITFPTASYKKMNGNIVAIIGIE